MCFGQHLDRRRWRGRLRRRAALRRVAHLHDRAADAATRLWRRRAALHARARLPRHAAVPRLAGRPPLRKGALVGDAGQLPRLHRPCPRRLAAAANLARVGRYGAVPAAVLLGCGANVRRGGGGARDGRRAGEAARTRVRTELVALLCGAPNEHVRLACTQGARRAHHGDGAGDHPGGRAPDAARARRCEHRLTTATRAPRE
mmetsp:Transcript_41199/g.102497  ORF Transcript_41199/g.102497 Transcript_41199/m.102497 type:complete len:202 (+) Transcript_41199:467-1072(+)